MKVNPVIFMLNVLIGSTVFVSECVFALATPMEKTIASTTNSNNISKQNLINTATDLVNKAQMQEAFNLLSPYQTELAGEPDYDYLLGIAALDIGKINAAIFALERVLAVNPDHQQARAEIARAYLAAGEVSASKSEFEIVQKQNPPKEVSATIQKYLDIIESVNSGRKSFLRGYAEITIGNDSNVNTATSNKQIAVPFFSDAVLNLSSSGIAKNDTFGMIAAGFSMHNEFAPDWSVVGGANINKRNNSTELTYNTASADANIGINLGKGINNYLAVFQIQSFILNNVSYRDAIGMTTQWQHNLSNGSQFSSYFQYSGISYPDQAYRNADRFVIGGAYATSLGHDSTTVMYTGAYVGSERVRQSELSYLSNSFFGGRLGGEIKFGAKFALLTSASVESRTYGGEDSLFLVTRKDVQSDIKISINYLPTKEWTISPSIAYTKNDSNIVINKYDRTLYSISARRDFN